MKPHYNIFKCVRQIKKISEVNNLIKGIYTYGLNVVELGIGAKYKSFEAYMSAEGEKWRGLSAHIIIHLKDTQLEITSKFGPELLKACTYIFQLNEELKTTTPGIQTFAQLNRWFKIKKAEEYHCDRLNRFFDEKTGKYICSAKPTLGYNPKYQNLELNDCYKYDLNSAYFNVLLKKVPDLEKPIYNSKVKVNQVGFLLDDRLTMVKGPFKFEVDVVFDLIDSPDGIKGYCDKWYNIKKNAKSEQEKLEAKAYLNLPIGYSQRYNPFFRAYVVNSCNELIDNLVNKHKEHVLFWNTDAIFTTQPIEELEVQLGKEIGQWKKIEGKKLRYIGNNYQIDDEIPVYRGIPKAWFKAFEKKTGRKFDLLKDKPPKRRNNFEWNWKTLSLERIVNWDE